MDWRSFVHNNEVNTVVPGNDFSRQMHAAFERDLTESAEILLEEWERRSLGMRMRELAARGREYWL